MAERCERTAETLPDIEIKRQFKALAQQWRDLAKHAAGVAEEPSNKPAG